MLCVTSSLSLEELTMVFGRRSARSDHCGVPPLCPTAAQSHYTFCDPISPLDLDGDIATS